MQFDNFGQWALGSMGPEAYESRILRLILELCQRGYTGQLLISHDAFNISQYRAYGGGGFCYIAERVLPRLEDLGVGPAILRELTVTNPARFLTGGALP